MHHLIRLQLSIRHARDLKLRRKLINDKKTFPKPQKQALKNVKVTKKSSKQMSTFSCEKCHQRPLAEFCLFSKFSGTFDDLHCPPLVWARSDGRCFHFLHEDKRKKGNTCYILVEKRDSFCGKYQINGKQKNLIIIQLYLLHSI